MSSSGGNYGRWTIYNASTLLYEHIHNTDDNVTDSWVVQQNKHGPFSFPAAAHRRAAATVEEEEEEEEGTVATSASTVDA